MTNPAAIAAITARLRNLLDQSLGVPGVQVTTLPLNQANDTIPTDGRVNLCLYEVNLNGQWRNGNIPWQVPRGETGQSPLPLNLYYLLTVFHEGAAPAIANGLPPHHRLLGLAMSILHDHPVVQTSEIIPLLDSYDQLENIRITYEHLSLDQILRLFESAQTPYAISVAYQVSVVLIQSSRPSRTPLPVLTIGQNDRGVRVEPSLLPPFPTLTSLKFPHEQPRIQIDETLILEGHHLDRTAESSLRFLNLRRSQEIVLPLAVSDNSTELSVLIELIEESAEWIAGFYNVSAEIIQDETQNRTNELSVALAPRIDSLILEPPQPIAEEEVILTLECTPPVQQNQEVSLLLGDRNLAPIPTQTFPSSTLVFDFVAPSAGSYFIRLRVDGVDSLLILRTEATETEPSRLIFNPEQEVVIG